MSKDKSQGAQDIQSEERYLKERASRADIPKALKILRRAGMGKSPMKGDESPRKKRR